MNILLISPKSPNTFWSFKKALKFIKRKASYPPLGLLTIGAMLPKEWNKKLVDCNAHNLREKDIEWADMIFISAMIVQLKDAQKIVDYAKEKGKIVVAGGPGFTTGYKNFKGVDHYVLNEGEITLPLFLKDLKKGKAKKVYTSMQRPDITKTPIPLWSLINLKDYATMALQFSRGCPFNCEFCDIIIMNGRIPRTKTPMQLISELESLYVYGWRGTLFIVDDNFIGNKKAVKEMLQELIKWQKLKKYPFSLMTEASINLAQDTELMQLMSKANFYNVFVGIESPNVDSLLECEKTQNSTADLSEAVKIIHKNGMQVMGGFIVGFDNDTESIFEAQIKFIQKVGVVTAMVGVLNALPQTRLWHRLKSEGRLLKHSSGENTDGNINFVPKMGKDKLIEGYKKILKRIYSHKNYYKRIDTFVNDYKPTVKSKISGTELIALIKSMWIIGILSKARVFYWKLLIKTSIKNRGAFPAAVQFAIQGMHFESISKKVLAENIKR